DGLGAGRRHRAPGGLARNAVAGVARRRGGRRAGAARDIHPRGGAVRLSAERGRSPASLGRAGALEWPRRARPATSRRGLLGLALLERPRAPLRRLVPQSRRAVSAPPT